MARKIGNAAAKAAKSKTPVLAPKGKPSLRKLAKPVAAAQPAVQAPRSASRVTHEVETGYAGASPGFTRNKSRTAVPVNEFRKLPDMVLTVRTNGVLAPLKVKYGKKPFARGNLDAGVLKYGIWKGHIEPLDTSESAATSESAQFRFTDAALATR